MERSTLYTCRLTACPFPQRFTPHSTLASLGFVSLLVCSPNEERDNVAHATGTFFCNHPREFETRYKWHHKSMDVVHRIFSSSDHRVTSAQFRQSDRTQSQTNTKANMSTGDYKGAFVSLFLPPFSSGEISSSRMCCRLLMRSLFSGAIRQPSNAENYY